MTAHPIIEKFRTFLENKKILIVDESSSCRTGIASTLVDMGATQSRIRMSGDFDSALRELNEARPEIVLSEYHLGDRCGLSLIHTQKQLMPNAEDRLFIVITSNANESAVADAAEEEVDGYLLKPFTADAIRTYLIKAATPKINPSEYHLTIQSGKQQMEQKAYEAASKIFWSAIALNDSPSLAFFYHGQAEMLRDHVEISRNSFESGLKYNPIHYKCLEGLYHLDTRLRDQEQAYQHLRKIAQNFPMSGQKLEAAIRLAIETGNFSDMDYYYDVYRNLDFRSPQLIKHLCAGLIVTGRYYLQNQRFESAVKSFRKATLISNHAPAILREIVVLLSQKNGHEHAKDFLTLFHATEQQSSDYLAMELIAHDTDDNIAKTIDQARRLIQRNVHDPVIYLTLIRRSVQAGLQDAAEHLAIEAARRWPELKDSVNALTTPKTST